MAAYDSCGMTVGFSWRCAYRRCSQAAHPGLNPGLDIIYEPAVPDRSAIDSCGRQRFVFRDCGVPILFPWPADLADLDERCGSPVNESSSATAGIIRPLGYQNACVFSLGDPVKQLRKQDPVITVAGQDLQGEHFRDGGVYGPIDLRPLVATLTALVVNPPLSINARLD